MIKGFLDKLVGEDGLRADDQKNSERSLRVATAAMLLEIASIDDEFSDDERRVIVELLKTRFDIGESEVEAILAFTEKELARRIDLYSLAQDINTYLKAPERIEIMKMIWRVIYADRHLDGHEDYLVHKMATILKLQHSQLIDAKMAVRDELGLE